MQFILFGKTKMMLHLIPIFASSSVLKHVTELGPRALILKFNTVVRWLIHLHTHMDSFSANYIV